MEGYARHSRSHSKAPPPPASAGTGAGFKKAHANGGAGNGMMAYDDVFGVQPKFGVTQFAPRAEDYSEIFGSFLSSRTSSIPMLDLPPVDDVVGCSGFEYSDVFGGFDFADFAVPYDELFGRSHGGEESSDDAWTQVGTESLSEESDPSAYSERNPYFLNGDFHQSLDCNQLNVSYHKVNSVPAEDSNITHIARLSAVSGYTYVIEGSNSLQKEDEERYSSGVADDIILCEDSSGNKSVETLQKTSPIPAHGYVGEQLHDYDKKAGITHRTGDYYMKPTFVSVSDNNLRKGPSHLPSPSTPPPIFVDRKEDSVSSSSDCEHSKSCTAENIVDGGSLHFFDLELDAGSSAVASAAAIKEAMDRAKIKLKSAKELMERKKDGLKGTKPGGKNDMNGEGKARMVFAEAILSNHEQQKTCKREQDQFMDSGKDMRDASIASQVFPVPMPAEHAVNGPAEHAHGRITENYSPCLDHGLTEGADQWKEARQYYKLVNSCNPKVESSLPHNVTKIVHKMNNSSVGNANGKAASLNHLEPEVEEIEASAQEKEDSKSDEEPYDPRENRRRLRVTKAASRKEFHEKIVKVAQEVHERVFGDHMESEKNLKGGDSRHGIKRDFEIWPEGKNYESRYDQASHQVDPEEKHKGEPDMAGSEFRSREDLLRAEYGNKEADREGRRLMEAHARQETQKSMKEAEDKDENGKGLKKAHQIDERKEGCAWNEEARERPDCGKGESSFVVNEALEQKEDKGKSERATRQASDVRLNCDDESAKRLDELWGSVGNALNLQEADRTEHQNNVEEAVISDFYEKKLKDSVEMEELENHEVATEDRENNGKSDVSEEGEMDKFMQECELEETRNIYEGTNKQKQKKFKDDMLTELKSHEQHSYPGTCLNVESEYLPSLSGPSGLDEKKIRVPGTTFECEDLKTFDMASSLDQKDIKQNAVAWEHEEKSKAHVAQEIVVNEEKSGLGCEAFIGEMESNVAEMEDVCTSTEHLHKNEAVQPTMAERKENVQKISQSSQINQGVRRERNASNGSLAAEDTEKAEKVMRDDGLEKEHLRRFEEEKVRGKDREMDKECLRKVQEERENERNRKMEEHLRKLEELRKKEQERELEKDCLRKLDEERDREKELEKERLRKLEEEWEREREREKDRMGVELKTCEARERAFAEARERAERAAVERASAEARQRAMAEARERLEKACAEARQKSLSEKVSAEARLRAERAAVERATAEARERAIEKAMAERSAFGARVERSSSEKISSSLRDMGIRHCLSSSDLWNTEKSDGVEGESAQRCRARLERHRRTVERVAKALAEKNMRDLIAQREQAERNRLAETLDAEIKRWSGGKEGNLRALLSTLQYILGPDSGWQPIPLTEVITSAAVKKAYRKATLCVHPDKLQQRGATIQQKYICEKVFDLLKDAWNRFNSEER